MGRKCVFLLCLALVLAASGAAVAFLGIKQTHTSPGSESSTGTPTVTLANIAAPHVQGTPLVLRGAEFDSSLIYIFRWEKGKRPTKHPLDKIFQTMASGWRMNVVRVPVSNWIYVKYTGEYTSQLDQVVQAAISAGLYVVLALHEDVHAGSPSQKGDNLPKAEDVTFWKAIAAHYGGNPKIVFDLFNEPKDPDWSTWLRGGKSVNNVRTVGFLDLIAAVRSIGAPQIVIEEPGSVGNGSANGGNVAQEGGWTTFGSNIDAITDPNVMYSLHVYDTITYTPAQFKAAGMGELVKRYLNSQSRL